MKNTKEVIEINQKLDNLRGNISWAANSYDLKLGFVPRIDEIREINMDIAFKLLKGLDVDPKQLKDLLNRVFLISKEYYWSSIERYSKRLDQESGGKLKDLVLPKETLDKIEIVENKVKKFYSSLDNKDEIDVETQWKSTLIEINQIISEIIRKKRVGALKICGKFFYGGIILIFTILAYFKGENLPFSRNYLFIALGIILIFTYYLFGLSEKTKKIIKDIAPMIIVVLATILITRPEVITNLFK
jgi:hypothetical protein